MKVSAVEAPHESEAPIMQAVKIIGLDIAKSVFQGVDTDRQVVIRRKLKRRYVLSFFEKLLACLVGLEACATSHHWSRELQAVGHRVRLMPPGGLGHIERECFPNALSFKIGTAGENIFWAGTQTSGCGFARKA